MSGTILVFEDTASNQDKILACLKLTFLWEKEDIKEMHNQNSSGDKCYEVR